MPQNTPFTKPTEPLRLSDIPIPPLQSALTEWGIPQGRYGRPLLIKLLHTRQAPTLWMSDQMAMDFYPQPLHNLGQNLKNLHTVQNRKPFKNMRLVFTENTYPQIILDTSEFLSRADLNFLARMARTHRITIFLIRHFFLTPKIGNPFAKNRFNSSFCLARKQFIFQILKGARPQKAFISTKGLL